MINVHGAECAYRKPNKQGMEGVMNMAKAVKKPAVKKAVKKSTKKGY